MTITGWFILGFWGLAAIAIILGIAISAEEWITEKFSEGDHDNG